MVPNTRVATLQKFVYENTGPDATVYTDEATAYKGLDRDHESIKHSAKEYVRFQASTNGIESFWSMLKRGHDGVYHHMSPKHLNRYVQEFSGRHNNRPLDTEEQMGRMAQGSVGKHLSYKELVGPRENRMRQGLA